MYHLRLCKALSYDGEVSATRQSPDVYVEDKATADRAVATGYFALIGSTAEAPPRSEKGHLDKDQLKDCKLDDLKKLAADIGVDTSGLKKKQEFIDAICAEEVGFDPEDGHKDEADETENHPDYEKLEKMTKEELAAFAKENGVDISGCESKEDILTTISMAFGGSATMMELQKEV